MSDRYQGGVIRAVPLAPTSGSASGIWTMEQQAKAQAAGNWPSPPLLVDPYFNQTSMLLGGEPANNLDYSAFSDASTNNFLITPTGTPYGNAFSPYNSTFSNYFDGTGGDWLTVPDSNGLDLTGDFTVEFWVYNTGTQSSNYGTIFDKGYYDGSGVDSTTGFLLQYAAGYMKVFSSGTNFTSSTIDAPGVWVFYQCIRSGSTVTLYRNAVSVGSASMSSTHTNSRALGVGANNLAGGGNSAGASAISVVGYISNLRVLNGTAATPAVPTAPLTNITNTTLLTCQSNRFLDNSSTAATITVNGTVTVSGFIPFADTDTTTGSGYFDGSGDYGSIAYNSNTSDLGTGNFTVEAWAYFANVSSGGKTIVGTGNYSSPNFMYQLRVDTATPKWFYGNSGSQNFITSSTNISANTWYHFAVVRNSGTTTMYINGTSVGSASDSSNYTTTDATYIGCANFGSLADFMNGYISNLRIVKGTAVYTTTFTPPSSPLTAISGTSILTLQDRAANQNFGFLDTTKQNLITKAGNATQGTFSPFSQANGYWSNYFDENDAASDYMTVPDTGNKFDFGSSDFSIEVFAYYTATGEQHIVSKRNTSGPSGFYFAAGGSRTLEFTYWSGGTEYNVMGGTVTANGWKHLVACRTGSTISVYINGTRTATASISGSIDANSTNLYVGAAADPLGRYTTGYLSNLRISTTTSVYDATQTTITVPTSPLTATANTQLLMCQSNRFIDNSANGFAVTVVGNPSVQSFGPFAPTDAYSQSTNGGSYYGDGTGDCLTIPPNPSFAFGTSDMTIECWVYLNSTSGYQTLVDLRASAGFGASAYTLWVDSGTLSFYAGAYSAGSPTIQSGSMTTGQWYHVALTRASGTNRLFLNGVQQTSNTNAWNNTYSASNSLSIGATTIGTSNYLSGYISNVRIINGAAAYTSNFTPPTAPLTATSATALLCNFTNAGVWDSAARNDLETVANAQLVTSTSKFGSGSYYFDGTGDYLKTPATNPMLVNWYSGSTTLEAWIYPTASVAYTNSYPGLITNAATASNTNYWGFGLNNQKLRFAWYDGSSQSLESSANVTLNTWTHIAFVYNKSDGSVKLFINGTIDGSGTLPGTPQSDASLGVLIGGWYGGNYAGYVDDLRITQGVARYTTNFTPANYPFPVK